MIQRVQVQTYFNLIYAVEIDSSLLKIALH